MLLYVFCWPILAWLAGQLVPAIGAGDFNKVSRVIFQSLAVFLLQKIAQYGQDSLLAEPALYISQTLRKNIFASLQKIELSSLVKFSSGDMTYRLTEDADRIGEVIYKSIQDTVPCALQLIAVYSYMLWIDWKLSLATLLLAPFVALLVSIFGSRVMIAAENSQKRVSDLAGLLNESIQGLPLVRAYAAEPWLQKRFEQEIKHHRKARYKTLQLLALQHPIVGFIEAAGILTILAIGALRIQSGNLDAQGFSTYVAGLLMLIDPISHLTTNYNEFQQGKASLLRLREIERMPLELPDNNMAKDIGSIKGNLKIQNLTFGYSKESPVLKDVSIELNSGKMLAIVGASGAGKSTLFSLILRFKRPQKGSITIDDKNINDIKVRELRKQIAIVPQQINVFTGSISDCICFGRNVEENKIIEAAKIANAHNFISELTNGYKTQIEERGSNLSGGQLQRIAIARAILGNPSLLLLDEATSALDAEAETAVQIGLKQAMKSRTVIVIAHRLATVQEADNIVVLDKGIINDIGNHEELIKRGGLYRDFCRKQIIRDVNG